MEAVKDIPNIQFYTSMKKGFGCAIGVVGFEPKRAGSPDLEGFLFNEYKIHVTTVNWENVHGVRITPNVYTTTKDLDRLITALRSTPRHEAGIEAGNKFVAGDLHQYDRYGGDRTVREFLPCYQLVGSNLSSGPGYLAR